jgi:hypothetical protein
MKLRFHFTPRSQDLLVNMGLLVSVLAENFLVPIGIHGYIIVPGIRAWAHASDQ